MAQTDIERRLYLANDHLADCLVALDEAHNSQGCHCPKGRCVLAQEWVPSQIRRVERSAK